MAIILPNGKQNYETATGAPLVGGKVFTYDTGTNNPRPTYSDAAGLVPNANPVILDARGEALIFWSGVYRVTLKDSLDNTIWSVDGVTSNAASAFDNYSADGGIVNAYVANGGVAVSALTAGLRVALKINVTNTGASTLNYGALGVKSIIANGFALTGGEMQAPNIYTLEYDGASFELLNPAVDRSKARTAAETAAAIIPTFYGYAPGDPRRFGMVGDGVTDDTLALTNWLTVPGYKFGLPVTCKISGELPLLNNSTIDFNGMTLDASAGGAFTHSSALYNEGTLTAISNLSVSPAEGADSLTFVAAHTLAAEDVGIIYNPTNNSWSGKQTYYRAGEFFKVEYITSATIAKIWDALYYPYAFGAVNIYKLTKNEITLSNLTIIGVAAGFFSPIRIRLSTKIRLRNVKGIGSDYTGINLDRCYDVEIESSQVGVPVQVAASKYGISVGNSQHVRIRGCELRSVRHAVNIGGDDFTGVVPNRDIRISDSYLVNDSALSLVSCCDVHGNSQDIWYENCTIIGGGSFGGRDVHYIDCNFRDFYSAAGAVIVTGSEWLGGIAEVRGGYIRGSLAYTQGIVRGFNDANSTTDTTLIVDGVTVYMDLCDTFVRADLSNAAVKINARVTNITFLFSPNLTQILRMVGTGAAGDGDWLEVDDIVNAPNGAILYQAVSGYGAAVRCKLMQQMGTASKVTTAATADNLAITFRYSYGSKIPRVLLSHDVAYIGAIALISRPAAKTAVGFTASCYSATNVAYAAGTTVNFDYLAGLSE